MLGGKNANNAFELIISDHPDQHQMVALAKENLDVLRGAQDYTI